VKRTALSTLAALFVATTSASAEVCPIFSTAETEGVVERLPPDCQVRLAFEASFGKRGLRLPKIDQVVSYAGFDPNHDSQRHEYEISLFDEESARQIADDDQEFNLARVAFSAALKREMCQHHETIAVVEEGGKIEFQVTFLLGEATQENGWKVLLQRTVRTVISSCEAN
jgi:hypothetical protein